MFDRGLEPGAHRPPERREHPLRALRILPPAERAPDSDIVERLGVGAEQRRGVERGAMIFAAKAVTIQQP
jgi:hypothetical protein